MNFTPGPWKWDGPVWKYDPEEECPWLYCDADGSTTILEGRIKCRSKADANLIAAAPDLFAVCEKLSEACELEGDLLMSLIKEARVALAKVTS